MKKITKETIGFAILGLGVLIEFLAHGEIIELFMVFLFIIGIILIVLFGLFAFPYVLAFIGKIIGKSVRKIRNFNKDDFIKNKDYYREILEINSPLLIGYIDNFELDLNKVIAELLYLRKENLIDIKEEKIEKNNNSYNIKTIEKEILARITDGKLKINISSYRERIAKQAEEILLIKRKRNIYMPESKIKVGIIIFLFFFVTFIIAFKISEILRPIHMIIIWWPLVMFVFFLLCIGFFGGISDGCGELYKRTAKGRELNQKLEGLKNYLKDYSMLSEREAKEIELWDDYLIYSVMFGQNKKIIEEYEKYIEIIE